MENMNSRQMRSACRLSGFLLLTASIVWLDVAASSPRLVTRLQTGHAFLLLKEGSERNVSFWNGRGGATSDVETTEETELTLDEKVQRAMQKLGMTPPSEATDRANQNEEREGGVCPVAIGGETSSTDTAVATETSTETDEKQEDVQIIADRIAKDMNVDQSLAMAAIGATSEVLPGDNRIFNEDAARSLIQQELNIIETVAEDSEEVKQLVSEGYDVFLSRRALAFAEMNMDDARAILIADQLDEEEEAKEAETAFATEQDEEAQMRAQLRAEAEAKKSEQKEELKTISVDASFDPTAPAAMGNAQSAASMGFGGPPPQPESSMKPPPPAKKSDVVFDATSAQVQELVMESPVPVLLDVYADWCGPCKALTPALEEMAVKAGGIFRLVKINSDNERAISGALEVTGLPSVFGIRDGKIVHMFQGMPRNEEFMKNFMMGLLMPGANFDPPVSAEEQKNYASLSSKLAKTAGAACFSFSARERLQDRTASKLDELVDTYGGDMVDAEESAKVLRSLLSNVIRDPYENKFRSVNLQNKVIAAKMSSFPACVSILKSVGFVEDGAGTLSLAKSKKVVNVAPLVVARDCIDKWIDKNRYEVAAATRKRKDEIERARIAAEAEAEAAAGEEDEYDDEDVQDVDPDACTIKLRLEGKKKVDEILLNGDMPLSAILEALPIDVEEGEEVQLTCAAKRLVVKSTDEVSMNKSLREHGLLPVASVVVKVGGIQKTESATAAAPGRLAERAAAQKNKKKGSHTMQSVGIYAKDDNNKAELIDGGGGVWYEHDVSDDENDDGEPEATTEEERHGANNEEVEQPDDTEQE